MKKLVLFAAVIAAVSLSACKKAATPAEAPKIEEEITVVEEVANDTIVSEEVATETPAEVAE